MKILFIGNVGFRVNSFLLSSAAAAVDLGIEFHVAAFWTGYDNPADRLADEEKYGIRIHQIDFKRKPYDIRNIKAYRQVVSLIKREEIDFIHCNTPIGGVVGRLAGKKCRIRRILYQAHGFHFYNGAPLINWCLYYPIERMLAHLTDAIITINTEDYIRSQNRMHLRNNGRVYYVHGVGIEIPSIDDSSELRIRKRDSLCIPHDAIVLISVGDLNKNKNNEVVIKAIKRIKDRNIYYVLCGDGERRKKLSELSSLLGDRVLFLGYRTDVNELLLMSDIFVLPSKREGLSRSLMEAMASRLPCVVSRIRGNTDLIKQKHFLCSPCNPLEFCKAIEDLADSIEQRQQVGIDNFCAVQQFSVENVIEEMKEVYRHELLSEFMPIHPRI